MFEIYHDQFRYPDTIQDVICLVNSTNKIRCAGALHSCAPLISSQVIVMSLTKLDNIIDIDVEQIIVKFQAGARIHDRCAEPEPHKGHEF